MSGEREPAERAKVRRRAGVITAARLAAVQALYQIELGGGTAESVVAEFVRHRLPNDAEGRPALRADPGVFAELVRGTASRGDDIDRMIADALEKGRSFSRLEALLRAILRVGTYELLGRCEVPARVVINEYVDVAHAFYDRGEPGLVNGVLDRLAHLLRANELGGTGDRS